MLLKLSLQAGTACSSSWVPLPSAVSTSTRPRFVSIFCQDIANDVLQILTFIVHADYWFAGFMVFFVGLNCLLTVSMVAERSILERFDLFGEARLCLARKVHTKAWIAMLFGERIVEAPGTGLIGPYGASLLSLTPLQAASALYGFYSSAKAMAEGRLDVEAGRRNLSRLQSCTT